MWWEILIYLLIPIIIEIVLWVAASMLKKSEQKFLSANENASDDIFEVTPSWIIKQFYLLLLICGAILEILFVVISLAAFSSGELSFVESLLLGICLEIIFSPIFIVGLYFYNRKIYFFKDKFIVKSLFIKKEIKLSDIKKVKLKPSIFKYKDYKPKDNIIIYYRHSRLVLHSLSSNFDRVELLLKNNNLIENPAK